MQPSRSLWQLLLVLLSLMQHAASTPDCSINKLTYKPYAFQPNCSHSKTLNTSNNLSCIMAAAMSPVPSAVVTSLVGDWCHVTPALCPRYRITNDSTVLMPVPLTTLELLIMSVKSGCGQQVWNLITQSAVNSDYAVQTAAHPDSATLPDTFRSSLLDNMQRLISALIYKQFIVQLYKNSTVVVRLVFDVGVSPETVTNVNWFDKSRLVDSWPVTNLKTRSTNYFSIAGHAGGTLIRRFFISFNYGGCDVDRALINVLDVPTDDCAMYKFSQPVPRIVYSSNVDQKMETTIRDADYLAVLFR